MIVNNELYYPAYDLGEFRYVVARYVKLLIRARWCCEPRFLSEADLTAWGLADIATDQSKAALLMGQAADTLGHLNYDYLPRCGSGGVKETDQSTPAGRLIWAVVDLVPTEGGDRSHNFALVEAAQALAEDKSVNWTTLVEWSTLPAIRADLDLLPHPKKENPDARLERIESQLTTLVSREKIRDWYTTEEFAKQVGKAEFTVRAWCRNGRVKAQKRHSGRGATPAWVVSHDELLRYQREGLIPVPHRGTLSPTAKASYDVQPKTS